MCAVCKDWELGKLTWEEAFRNIGEMIEGSKHDIEELEHLSKILGKIMKDATQKAN